VIAKLYREGLDVRSFLLLIVLLGLAVTISGTTADPDLWGHVRFGLDILDTREISQTDPYSFTSDRAWVNHEWLAEVLFALAYRAAGPFGLNLLRLSIIAIVLALVWRRLAPVANSFFVVIAMVVTVVGIVWRVYPVRPQLFSVLMFALLLYCLTRFDTTRSARTLAAIPIITGLWANFHGGWIVGLGTLGAWTAMRIVFTDRTPRTAALLLGTSAAALATTLLNPYGVGLWAFIQSTVGLGRPLISDWLPMFKLPPAFWVAWIVPSAILVVACVRLGRRIDPAYVAIAALLGIGALRVSRLDAFFALAVVFLLLPAWIAATAPSGAADRPRRRSRLIAALTVPAVAAALLAVSTRLTRIDVRPSFVPELEAETYVRSHRLAGRMLTWFDWGQYVIWQFGPQVQVSMDGRRETVYSDAMFAAHMRFYSGEDGAVGYPDAIGADYIWIPKRLTVASALRAAGWRAAFEGPESLILVRADRHAGPPSVVSETADLPRTFPRRTPAGG